MINRSNWIDTKAFLAYQKGALQNDVTTVKRLRVALRPLLEWAGEKPFPQARTFDPTFPAYLASAKTESGTRFSVTGGEKTLQIARQFFAFARSEWPSKYKSISESWIQTLQPAKRNSAQSRLKEHAHYTLEDVLKLAALPVSILQDRRDIAAVCFMFLSGMRVGAFTSLPLECVDLKAGKVYQLPEKGVRTKNRKAAITYLLPIPELMSVVTSWHEFVSGQLAPSDLWYPVLTSDGDGLIAGRPAHDNRGSAFGGRLKILCNRAEIPYLRPHCLRHGHVVYGLKNVKNMEGVKAVSQNVMHSSIAITDGIYGGLSGADIQKVITSIGLDKQPAAQPAALESLAVLLSIIQNNPDIIKTLTGK